MKTARTPFSDLMMKLNKPKNIGKYSKAPTEILTKQDGNGTAKEKTKVGNILSSIGKTAKKVGKKTFDVAKKVDPVNALSVAQGINGVVRSNQDRDKKVNAKPSVSSLNASTQLLNSAKRNYSHDRETALNMGERTRSTNRRAVANEGGGNVLNSLNASSKAMDSGNTTALQGLQGARNRLGQAQVQGRAMQSRTELANSQALNQADARQSNMDFQDLMRRKNTSSQRIDSSIKNLLLNKKGKKLKKAKNELDEIIN